MSNDKIRITCPHCQITGMAPASLQGKNVKCHRCGETFTGSALPPEPQAAPAPPPPPRPEPAVPAAPRIDDVPSPEPPPPPITPDSPPPEPAVPTPPAAVKRVRANRVLAGKVCPVCKVEIMLGDEVVQCESCEAVTHQGCWTDSAGCTSSRCAATTPGRAPVGPMTMCRACAESIPEDSRVCPYCAEAVGGSDSGLLPMSFITGQGDLFTTKWNFTATSTELTGTAPGKPEICITRNEASSEITVTGKKMILTIGGKRRKFTLDDVGLMAVRAFLGEPIVPRPSVVAKEALIYAICGIFCCQIVLGLVAISKAARAKEMINLYPEAITGRGTATAATVIGVIDVILFAVSFLVRVMNQAGA